MHQLVCALSYTWILAWICSVAQGRAKGCATGWAKGYKRREGGTNKNKRGGGRGAEGFWLTRNGAETEIRIASARRAVRAVPCRAAALRWGWAGLGGSWPKTGREIIPGDSTGGLVGAAESPRQAAVVEGGAGDRGGTRPGPARMERDGTFTLRDWQARRPRANPARPARHGVSAHSATRRAATWERENLRQILRRPIIRLARVCAAATAAEFFSPLPPGLSAPGRQAPAGRGVATWQQSLAWLWSLRLFQVWN